MIKATDPIWPDIHYTKDGITVTVRVPEETDQWVLLDSVERHLGLKVQEDAHARAVKATKRKRK